MATIAKFAAVQPAPAPLRAEDILTPAELSKRLKVPVSWVYKKSAQNGFPVLRCGRYLRFSWPDVCEWLRGEGG